MESLPPLGEHERQHEDMLYSPEDFNPDMELPAEEFCRFFRQHAERLVEDYRKNRIKISRHLVQESRCTDKELSDIYARISRTNKKGTMSWGDFRDFVTEWEAYWDGRHPLP